MMMTKDCIVPFILRVLLLDHIITVSNEAFIDSTPDMKIEVASVIITLEVTRRILNFA